MTFTFSIQRAQCMRPSLRSAYPFESKDIATNRSRSQVSCFDPKNSASVRWSAGVRPVVRQGRWSAGVRSVVHRGSVGGPTGSVVRRGPVGSPPGFGRWSDRVGGPPGSGR